MFLDCIISPMCRSSSGQTQPNSMSFSFLFSELCDTAFFLKKKCSHAKFIMQLLTRSLKQHIPHCFQESIVVHLCFKRIYSRTEFVISRGTHKGQHFGTCSFRCSTWFQEAVFPIIDIIPGINCVTLISSKFVHDGSSKLVENAMLFAQEE